MPLIGRLKIPTIYNTRNINLGGENETENEILHLILRVQEFSGKTKRVISGHVRQKA